MARVGNKRFQTESRKSMCTTPEICGLASLSLCFFGNPSWVNSPQDQALARGQTFDGILKRGTSSRNVLAWELGS